MSQDKTYSISLKGEANEILEQVTRLYGFDSKTAALYEIIKHAPDILRIWIDLGDQSKQASKDLQYKGKIDTHKELLKLRGEVDLLKGQLKEYQSILRSSKKVLTIYYRAVYRDPNLTCPHCKKTVALTALLEQVGYEQIPNQPSLTSASSSLQVNPDVWEEPSED